MNEPLPSRLVANLRFVGWSDGPVKSLEGFKKGHHSVPDAVTPATQAFLGRLCAAELGRDAEALFQEVRTAMAYKRREVSLNVAPALATLAARDFAVEIAYVLDEADPSRYRVSTVLRELQDADLARQDGFSRVFASRFSELSFELTQPTRVEAVIDAIEDLDGAGGLTVQYPSDYRECTLHVEGIEAVVCCRSHALDVRFPRQGSPAELLDGFAAIREAFQISKPLAGLLT